VSTEKYLPPPAIAPVAYSHCNDCKVLRADLTEDWDSDHSQFC
jgi:hypothetical protein